LENWRRKNRARRSTERLREPYTLHEIAERDARICGLCGGDVDMLIRNPDPRAPTIDHVVPLSLGGDDIKANVQLAHRACNTAKGARGSGEQLALIG